MNVLRAVNAPFRWILRYRNFWTVFLRKMEVIDDPYPVRIRNPDRTYLVRESRKDRAVIDEFYSDDGYKNLNLSSYNTIVDVGAHIGVFSVEAGKAAGSVYAFEANPDTFELLKSNLDMNNIDSATAHNFAVSGSSGESKISLGEGSLTDSIEKDPTGDNRKIQRRSLEGLIGQEVTLSGKSLLKLDCEGSEFKILRETNVSTLESFDTIFLEWHGEHGNPGELLDELQQAGFDTEEIPDPRSSASADVGYIKAQ